MPLCASSGFTLRTSHGLPHLTPPFCIILSYPRAALLYTTSFAAKVPVSAGKAPPRSEPEPRIQMVAWVAGASRPDTKKPTAPRASGLPPWAQGGAVGGPAFSRQLGTAAGSARRCDRTAGRRADGGLDVPAALTFWLPGPRGPWGPGSPEPNGRPKSLPCTPPPPSRHSAICCVVATMSRVR